MGSGRACHSQGIVHEAEKVSKLPMREEMGSGRREAMKNGNGREGIHFHRREKDTFNR